MVLQVRNKRIKKVTQKKKRKLLGGGDDEAEDANAPAMASEEKGDGAGSEATPAGNSRLTPGTAEEKQGAEEISEGGGGS